MARFYKNADKSRKKRVKIADKSQVKQKTGGANVLLSV